MTAIHVTHRLAAFVVLAAMALLAWRLRAAADPALHRYALGLALLGLWQLLTGLSNVVLGWPIAAAVAHTGGAALLAVLLASLLARSHQPARAGARRSVQAARPLGV